MITVFTPTFNRANYLTRLYNSLVNQTYKEFEWIVVDDGSEDNTSELIKSFILDDKIKITYAYTSNNGKHRALNLGARISNGDWIFFLDSDDWMFDNSLEILSQHILEIKSKNKINEYGAICGLCENVYGKIIGTTFKGYVLDTDIFSATIKYKISGDKAWAVRADLLKKYPFPEFDGEKFITESVWFNRITKLGYKARYFNTIIKKVEYLNDGLSSKYNSLLASNWNGTLIYYNEYMNCIIDNKIHVLSTIKNYIKIALVGKKNKKDLLDGLDEVIYNKYKTDIDEIIKSYNL